MHKNANMKEDDKILSKLQRRDGMTVPEGYFEQFAARMEASLPDRPELNADFKAAVSRTLWQRVRPYVYMAAMFGGVWCMLKMFNMMNSTPSLSLETSPTMAEAFSNETFVNECVVNNVNQWDLYDSLMVDGVEPEALLDSAIVNDDAPLQ